VRARRPGLSRIPLTILLRYDRRAPSPSYDVG
jgi:hypothetical protein